MRIAIVYDGVDESTGPYYTPDHPRIEDPAERERIAAFIGAGTPVLATTARDVDRIDRDRGKVVPVAFRTDGRWVWAAALGYYVATHGIAPEPEFVRHIVASGYQPAVPDEQGIREALAAVMPDRA